jgi:heme/copper-type cytochrome/quinol oxidase subunit 4
MAQETTNITDINQDKVTTMEKQVLGFITMPILAAVAPYIVLITSHEQVKSKNLTTMSKKSYNAR